MKQSDIIPDFQEASMAQLNLDADSGDSDEDKKEQASGASIKG